MVLYNQDGQLASGAEDDYLAVAAVQGAAQSVYEACRQTGYDVDLLPAPEDPAGLLRSITGNHPDVVFNLVEALRGESRFEAAVAWLLELGGWGYTGSPPTALSVCLDKRYARAILTAAGIPVPRGMSLGVGEPCECGDLTFPLIVKPSREDASHGIDADSVVYDPAALGRRVERLTERYRQPVVVEEFAEGRELNVSIIGAGDQARPLQLAEIDFSGLPPDVPRLVSYRAKWVEDSAEYKGTVSVAAADLPPDIEAATVARALAAYRALGLRDYGRVDLRVHPERGPVVLDVNPNPDISPDAGLALAARRSGVSYERLIDRIVHWTLERADGAAGFARRRP